MKKNSKQVTLIGAFVLGAVALLVFLLMTIGGNRLGRDSLHYRIYFPASVKGLNVGSPVMFRGIPVGEVERINLAPQEDSTLQASQERELEAADIRQDVMPVEVGIKIYPEKLGFYSHHLFAFLPHSTNNLNQAHAFLGRLVRRHHLRAQLETLSFLTGQIYISLNLLNTVPTEPKWLAEQLWSQGTIPSHLSLMARLSTKVDEQGLGNNLLSLQKLLQQVSVFVEEGKSKALLDNLDTTLRNLSDTAVFVRDQAPSILQNLQKTGEQAQQLLSTLPETQKELTDAIRDARALLSKANGTLEETRPELNKTLQQLQQTLQAAGDALQTAQPILEQLQSASRPNSPERQQLDDTLQECRQTMDQLRLFLETVNRNPQALLLGE